MLDETSAKFGVGQPAGRREDARFLTGQGRYVDDFRFDGQLFAAFARSPEPHAAIRGVDLSAARAIDGVVAAFAAEDIGAFGLAPFTNEAPVVTIGGGAVAPVLQTHLASGRVRFVGQPVAMIVATTATAARDAASLVDIDLESLPAVTSSRDAVAEGAPQLHEEAPGNRAYAFETGDAAATAAAFAEADVVVSTRVFNQRLAVVSMEPRAINAQYDAETGRWTVYCGTQGVHAMRGRIATQLQVEPERVRVITPDVGGGFGMKLMSHPEYALVAAAARALDAPVCWTAERTEAFLTDAQARDLDTEAEAAFRADGTLLAMRARSLSNLGAVYSSFGAGIHGPFSAPMLGGMYRLRAAHNHVEGVFTNATPMDAYRGAGRPEIAYVAERLMDAAAQRLGVDPAELRLKNLLTADDFPFSQPCGAGVYDSGDCKATLEKALAAADYDGFPARRADAAARGAILGVAASYYMERTGGGPVENARLRVTGDGEIVAWIGTQSTGQGHETAWSQLICDALGVSPDTIRFLDGDSDMLDAGGGTGGSRSLIMAHRVFAAAAGDVVEKGRAAAADLLEAAPVDIEYTAAQGGRFRIVGTDRSVGLFEAAAAADDGEILGIGGVKDRESTFPNGAHVAEVSLDRETGHVTLERYTIVDDFGTVLNPQLVLGQVHGGVAQGVGQALYEQVAFDPETAQPLTGSFMDYQMPRASDFPDFDVELATHAPAQTNPMGAKGCGEAGSVGAIPAATLAVYDALRSAGAETMETPLTPVKIWTALRATTA